MSDTFEWAGRSIVWHAVGDGPAVVLCHGTPFSSEVWRPYAEALAADFTVYTWDMPGYGRSSKRPEDPGRLRQPSQGVRGAARALVA